MSDAPSYPQPRADRDNAAFLEAWHQGRLLLQRCDDCGLVFFYPRPICPGCWSAALRGLDASGRGEIVGHSLVRRPSHESFFAEAPIILAEVRLEEGATMLARVIADDPAAVSTGMALELVPAGEAERYPLPTFRPRG